MSENVNLPPHNIEAEKGVISWVLLDNEVMWVYEGDKLSHKDFYQKEHGFIYEAIQQLWSNRKTIDPVTLSDQLDKMGILMLFEVLIIFMNFLHFYSQHNLVLNTAK